MIKKLFRHFLSHGLRQNAAETEVQLKQFLLTYSGPGNKNW